MAKIILKESDTDSFSGKIWDANIRCSDLTHGNCYNTNQHNFHFSNSKHLNLFGLFGTSNNDELYNYHGTF